MISAALCTMLQQGIADFLRMSFWSSTPGMEEVIERFIQTEGAVFKGPYVSVHLPFRQGGDNEFFPEVPLERPAFLHQEAAWQRLSGARPKSTIVATGTGSGKTESFLFPIFDYCRRNLGTPGVKAILVYPMNALATDQAKRIAQYCAKTPALAGLRAGLYIGESSDKSATTHNSMGADHIITDRARMRMDPPDILLTNYKMLDYLLVRPADQEMWAPSKECPVRFLVVDELHSFDGAQGTDLACLIRRLKARLGLSRGGLCCIGTSATLGGAQSGESLRAYATEIFGEDFDPGSVIGESRQAPAEFFHGRPIKHFDVPTDVEKLDPSQYEDPAAYVVAQQSLWLDTPIECAPGTDDWKVALGEQLLSHVALYNLVQQLKGKPVLLLELAASLAQSSRALRSKDKPELAQLVVVSLLSLISEARTWLPEREDARQRRVARREPRRTRPLLEVRLQLWQRELRRMVADLGGTANGQSPTLRYSDDLTDEQRRSHLPMIHCRDCGAMGWASLVARDRSDLFSVGLERLYMAFFNDDPQVRFLWPAQAVDDPKSDTFLRLRINPVTLTRERDDSAADAIEVAISQNVHTVSGHRELHKDCPFCGARANLSLVGFRASTLTSIFIDQLFTSRFNDDKKLLTFSDSVQDAAHRAGFFGARTWSFNLRVAIQKVVATAEGKTLAEIPDLFQAHWQQSSGNGLLGDVEFVSAFIAPNRQWIWEFEAMQKSGEIPEGTRMVRDVEKRIFYEIMSDYSLQSRIGRSLPRTGCSTVAVDSAALDAATDELLERLRNEIGGLRDLRRESLRQFLLGALHHLREAGGIDHAQLPRDFIESGGNNEYIFTIAPQLPSFTARSRLPALLTTDPRSKQFDIIQVGGASKWYERWAERILGRDAILLGAAADVWFVVLPVLVAKGLLVETAGKRGKIWGLSPGALRVTNHCRRIRCQTCRHWMVVAESELAVWIGAHCLSARCDGEYAEDDSVPVRNYFGRLIERGQVERVIPEEHTGLLDRAKRDQIEDQFKSDDRKPWYPNLLSCTPTLEMGIDIGSLSSAILCSVPPAQANYVQRVGRAGRRDGNSLVLTIAQARPHDLYFYTQPAEMIAGAVQPPGVFLNASAVLERQLAAFSLDQWNNTPGQHHFGRKLREVLGHLDPPNEERFPHNWLSFVRREQTQLLSDFVALFNEPNGPLVLTESSRAHLGGFLLGDDKSEGSLSWKVLDALSRERRSRDSIRKQARRLKDQAKSLRATEAKAKDHTDVLAEHEREQAALEKLANGIDGTDTLEFLTNEGLLPNYAFPEAPVRLRSIIWRKKGGERDSEQQYETKTFEYARPPVAALSDLAPAAQFYAGGRRVEIDQVDVEAADIETWRFCDACSHCTPVDHDDSATNCPQCGSAGWGETSQRRQLLRLQQVYSRTSDKESRIRDDTEEREPRFFNRHMLPTFREQDRQGAWKLDSPQVPFAFEYHRRVSFRELNFGQHSDDSTKYHIAGKEAARPGFVICKHCGKVQSHRRKHRQLALDGKGEHALFCTVKQRGDRGSDFESSIYLYREFSSEALRLLLPIADLASDRRLTSFVAAFQLGLKARYGGRVDHLHTLVYTEPERDSVARRQYLVVYDSVPGGTGYLKDLVQEPAAGQEHGILSVLRLARDRIRGCECFGDASRDGCYRCLFAYRNSRDMSETSAHEAMTVLTEILDQASTLVRTKSLSDVSISGLMDSVLEARFIEALQRFSTAELPVKVEKSLVRHKPGYRVTVGKSSQQWLIEPQVDLGSQHGVAVDVSIDFVMRPAATTHRLKPVAVFLDGFQYHRDRVGHDLLQRMSLLTTGEYDVWGFTWDDVDAAFHRTAPLPPMLLGPQQGHLKDWFSQLGYGQWASILDTTPIELLLKTLAEVDNPIPWASLGAIALIAQMGGIAQPSPATWYQALSARLPAVLRPIFNVDGSWLRCHKASDSPAGIESWVAVSVNAARDVLQTQEIRAVFWLDDASERLNLPEYREAWRGLLFAFLLLRALPQVLFLTRRGSDSTDGFARLAHLRGATGPEMDPRWAALDVSPGFEGVIAHLSKANVPIPEVGLDLPNDRGLSSGIEGELVWESRRVAVLRSLDGIDTEKIDPRWRLFGLAGLEQAITSLLDSLAGMSEGESA